MGAADWSPTAAAFSRLATALLDDPAAVDLVREALLEAARQQFALYSPLLCAYSDSRMSFTVEPESSLFAGGVLLSPPPKPTLPAASPLPASPLVAAPTAVPVVPVGVEGVALAPGQGSDSARGRRGGGGATASVCHADAATQPGRTRPLPAGSRPPGREMARRSRSFSHIGLLSDRQQRFMSVRNLAAMAAATDPDDHETAPETASSRETAAATPTPMACPKVPAGPATPVGVDQSAVALAGASTSSSPTGASVRADGLVPFAVESARRYSALLEAAGRLAPAAAVLEACVAAAEDRWGHRSGMAGAVRAQLARLQQLQGLHRAAEATWRQALEALERCHGQYSSPALLAQAAMAKALAALNEPGAEDSLRSALSAIDFARGPTAPETLAARRALAELLVEGRRWAEAEVAYQALLEAQEKAAGPAAAVEASPSAGSVRSRRGVAQSTSRQHLLSPTPPGQSPAQALVPSPGPGPWPDAGAGDVSSGASAKGVRRTDSRARVAWAGGLAEGGAAGATAGMGVAAPGQLRPGALPAIKIQPRSAGSGASSPLAPVAMGMGSSPSVSRRLVSTAGLGPGAADAVLWSGDAAALADVIAAVQREYGGVNELYGGMHLVGPEGSTFGDLTAAAAVCPRSGACIAAVVSARRLTDPIALYEAALAARRSALGAGHPLVLELMLQYARYLSAAGQHAEAEAACRAAYAQLTAAAAPCGAARRHPAEVAALLTLGGVLRAAGALPAAASALQSAAVLAEQLVAAGELAAADSRRIDLLEALSEALFEQAGGGGGGANTPPQPLPALGSSQPTGNASKGGGAPSSAAALLLIARAVELKCQALDLTAAVVGQRHERIMRGWVALGGMAEAAGDLRGAERALVGGAEVALHLHGRRAAATRNIFRQLQRVYRAQGREADAEVLGHMYRLNGGLLSRAAAQLA
ncbi:hypothetical protein GPECTOR_10g989 [Gonium pectorale]|uniref:MalT-like TPR region domain-containing protein n=1 Tax=Gonium pectorale TaxID=33097 RepID=A0A150GR95_GONPE|nr:hypothetical protein GPECTOR_10g989 [Gonium pectorale]|eukprot:KXZ52355.1 hypothetical protein GPECTOR_10g989 [Gonium pectorale]